MVPISFVSDHVETLYEINILYREQAAQLGMCLKPCTSLNTNPLFIQGLRVTGYAGKELKHCSLSYSQVHGVLKSPHSYIHKKPQSEHGCHK